MQSGAIYGTAAMIDGIADRIEEELGHRQHFVATGGLATLSYLFVKESWN
ncbi:MAG: hypothetical protein ACLR13_03805 [Acutalibacteraceae bacterium]